MRMEVAVQEEASPPNSSEPHRSSKFAPPFPTQPLLCDLNTIVSQTPTTTSLPLSPSPMHAEHSAKEIWCLGRATGSIGSKVARQPARPISHVQNFLSYPPTLHLSSGIFSTAIFRMACTQPPYRSNRPLVYQPQIFSSLPNPFTILLKKLSHTTRLL